MPHHKDPNVTRTSSPRFRISTCRRCGLTIYTDQAELRPLCARCATIERRARGDANP